MSTFLFTAWDGGGAVPPTLSLARALVERGHEVRVLGDPVLVPEIEAAGAEPIAWTRAPHRTERTAESDLFKDWEARTPAGAFARIRERLMFGRAGDVARDVLEELERRRADAIVTEPMLAGSVIAGEAAGVPVALIFTTIDAFPVEGRPPLGPGFQPARGPLGRLRDRAVSAASRAAWNRGLPAFNAARAELGLTPASDALGGLSEVDRILVLTSDAFDFPELPRQPKVRVVGPRLDDPAWVDEPALPAGEQPLVLVGLSSSHQGQDDVIRRAATALGELPVRGLVTTGPAVDPFPSAANVAVVRSAPHAAVLPHAAAVITHGGHGTVIKALAAGVPLVVLPMGRDQLDVAARVTAAGAGVRVKPKASPARIAAAVREVLDQPSYRRNAERLAAAIAEELKEDRAVLELEEMADRFRSTEARPRVSSP
jgi:MGT family glycosyltransferase